MNWYIFLGGVFLYVEASARTLDWSMNPNGTWKSLALNTAMGVLGMLLMLWS